MKQEARSFMAEQFTSVKILRIYIKTRLII